MLSLNFSFTGCGVGLSIFLPWPDYIWHLNFRWLRVHDPQEPGVRISRRRDPSADAALRHAPAKSDLHGHHARQETGRVGWAEESSRYGCAKRFKP